MKKSLLLIMLLVVTNIAQAGFVTIDNKMIWEPSNESVERVNWEDGRQVETPVNPNVTPLFKKKVKKDKVNGK